MMDEEMSSAIGYDMSQTKKTIRKTTQIGSIRNGTLNYPKDQKFFHANDVPEMSKVAAKEVKETIDKDIFKLKRPKWNPSVSKAKEIIDDNDEAKLFGIKKGFDDFFPLDTKPGKVYEGADTRNDYTKWNVSNELPTHLQRAKMIAEE